jgi:hypothetical protein
MKINGQHRKFEIIGEDAFILIKRHARNQIKMKKSCTNQSVYLQ